jgi:hypothetical protein
MAEVGLALAQFFAIQMGDAVCSTTALASAPNRVELNITLVLRARNLTALVAMTGAIEAQVETTAMTEAVSQVLQVPISTVLRATNIQHGAVQIETSPVPAPTPTDSSNERLADNGEGHGALAGSIVTGILMAVLAIAVFVFKRQSKTDRELAKAFAREYWYKCCGGARQRASDLKSNTWRIMRNTAMQLTSEQSVSGGRCADWKASDAAGVEMTKNPLSRKHEREQATGAEARAQKIVASREDWGLDDSKEPGSHAVTGANPMAGAKPHGGPGIESSII